MIAHTDFDLISPSHVKKTPFKEPTCLSIRVTGATPFSSVTPIYFTLHPTVIVNHPTYHYSS